MKQHSKWTTALLFIALSSCVKTTQDGQQGGNLITDPAPNPTSTATPVPTSTPVGNLTPGQQAGTAALVGCTLNIPLGTFTGINPYQPRGDVIATCPGSAVVSVSPMNGAPNGPLKWRTITGNKILSLYQWFTESGVYNYSFTVTNNSAQWTRIIQFEIGNRTLLNAGAPFRSALGTTCTNAQIHHCNYPTNLAGIATLTWNNNQAKCRISRPRTTIVLSAPDAPLGVTFWRFRYAKNTDPYSPTCNAGDSIDTQQMIAGAPSCKLAVDPVVLVTGRIPSAINNGDQHYFQYNAESGTGPGKVTIHCPVGSQPIQIGIPNSVRTKLVCEIWGLPSNSNRILEVSGTTVYLSAAVSGAPVCPNGMFREGVNSGRCIVGNFSSWSPYLFTDSASGRRSVLVNPSSTTCETDL